MLLMEKQWTVAPFDGTPPRHLPPCRSVIGVTALGALVLWTWFGRGIPCRHSSMRSGAALVHERHRLRPRHVAGLEPIDLESRVFDQRPDRPVQMAAAADAPPRRGQP